MFSVSATRPYGKKKILPPVHGGWDTWLSHTGIGAWESRSSNLLSSVFPASTSAQLAANSEAWKSNGRETAGVRAKSYRIFQPLGIPVLFHSSRMSSAENVCFRLNPSSEDLGIRTRWSPKLGGKKWTGTCADRCVGGMISQISLTVKQKYYRIRNN